MFGASLTFHRCWCAQQNGSFQTIIQSFDNPAKVEGGVSIRKVSIQEALTESLIFDMECAADFSRSVSDTLSSCQNPATDLAEVKGGGKAYLTRDNKIGIEDIGSKVV